MSADKPIQRYDVEAAECAIPSSDGLYVRHDDHLAAIRNARAEAFEEAAGRALTLVAVGKGPCRIYDEIKALAAKERAIRATRADDPPRSYGSTYGEWQS